MNKYYTETDGGGGWFSKYNYNMLQLSFRELGGVYICGVVKVCVVYY